MGAMTQASRLEIARWAIESLPARLKGAGVHQTASSRAPAFWELEEAGCKIVLTHDVLLMPVDPTLSNLLDVWLDAGPKVLSVSWFPDQPWVRSESVV